MFFGNLPEIVTLLDFMKHWFAGSIAATHFDIGCFHLGNAERIANCDNRLFEDGLIRYLALDNGFVALDLKFHLLVTNVETVQFCFQVVSRGWGFFIPDSQFLAYRFDEVEYAHGPLPGYVLYNQRYTN